MHIARGNSSTTPVLTVGLPFYNAQTTLERAIRSVFCQTFADWELILINDGSTDESASIARTVQADPRVTFIDNATNERLPRRLNQIAELARGEYLARMDADDLMHPARLRRQLEVLQSRPDVDVVGTAMFIMDRECGLLGLSRMAIRSMGAIPEIRRERRNGPLNGGRQFR